MPNTAETDCSTSAEWTTASAAIGREGSGLVPALPRIDLEPAVLGLAGQIPSFAVAACAAVVVAAAVSAVAVAAVVVDLRQVAVVVQLLQVFQF